MLSIWDYYSLGKLIHYTVDGFTFAHNKSFPSSLNAHRKYEASLEVFFLQYVQSRPKASHYHGSTIMDVISFYRKKYESREPNIYIDTKYSVAACRCILTLLFPRPVPQP